MEKTERIDARKIKGEELVRLRKLVVRLRGKGMSNLEVSRMTGLPPQTTSTYYQRYQKEGNAFFKVKSAGRPKESGKRLSKEEERQIIQLLVEKNPRQLQFPFALWTREAVQVLIERSTGKRLPLSTVGDYLQRWKFSAKRPIRRAYERKDAATRRWLEEEFPSIKKAAKAQKAEIWWADETASVSLPSYLRGYAPVGTHHKPVLEHPAKKFKLDMISAITPSGKSLFALYEGSIDTERFLDFLQRVIDSATCKVYLIVDNLRVHHAKRVKAWVEEHKEHIALFYLPPYSPEYNPDEYLNQDFKRNANKNKIPRNIEELKKNTLAYMNRLQKNPKKIASFFQHPSVRYAA